MDLPEKAMPEVATTHVWITVFSCLVKGCFSKPDLSRNFVQVFTKKNPNSPAETLREGMIPVVRLSFITMKVNKIPKIKLTTKARSVSWFCHDGTFLLSNILSTDSNSAASVFLFSPFPFCWSSSREMFEEVRSIAITDCWVLILKLMNLELELKFWSVKFGAN